MVLVANDKSLNTICTALISLGFALLVVACGSESSTNDGGGSDFWGGAYTPPQTASPVNYHGADTAQACMSCHGPTATGATTKLVYGGVVYQADGATPAPNVQVGVSDGTYKSVVYSAANGMYWATGTATVNWATADIRIRSANGEAAKLPADARSADCDACHHAGTASPLKAP